MLTRRAKAYSSSCSQTVSLSPVISLQFTLEVCAAAEDCKINTTFTGVPLFDAFVRRFP